MHSDLPCSLVKHKRATIFVGHSQPAFFFKHKATMRTLIAVAECSTEYNSNLLYLISCAKLGRPRRSFQHPNVAFVSQVMLFHCTMPRDTDYSHIKKTGQEAQTQMRGIKLLAHITRPNILSKLATYTQMGKDSLVKRKQTEASLISATLRTTAPCSRKRKPHILQQLRPTEVLNLPHTNKNLLHHEATQRGAARSK